MSTLIRVGPAFFRTAFPADAFANRCSSVAMRPSSCASVDPGGSAGLAGSASGSACGWGGGGGGGGGFGTSGGGGAATRAGACDS